MIEFTDIKGGFLEDITSLKNWLLKVVTMEEKILGEIQYIFCGDTYLHDLNLRFLSHDTLTDVIGFDYTSGSILSGDIYISTERVLDNSTSFNVEYSVELRRVMVHGLLHFCGYADSSAITKKEMRAKEDFYLGLY